MCVCGSNNKFEIMAEADVTDANYSYPDSLLNWMRDVVSDQFSDISVSILDRFFEETFEADEKEIARPSNAQKPRMISSKFMPIARSVTILILNSCKTIRKVAW